MREGEGPPVVLLPGLQGDPSVFAPLVAHLDGLEVWGGRLSRGGLSIDAACLEARLVRQGIERPRVVCGSYGGQVALRSSQYFQSLVLTGSFGNWTQLSRRQRLMLRASLRAPSAVLEDRYRAKLTERLVADGVPEHTAQSIQAPGGAALKARLRSLVRQTAPALRQPTLWLAGRDDPQAPWSDQAIKSVWSGIETRRVPGNHRPYASHPAEFAACLKQWWSSVDACNQDTGRI